MGPGSPEAGPLRRLGLPEEAAAALASAGFTVAGSLDIQTYDQLVPHGWQSAHLASFEPVRALVLGTGGGAFERAWRASAGERDEQDDPADAFARAALGRACRAIETRAGARAVARLYADRETDGAGERVFADFVALARACGLGGPGRIGLLLHPDYGPWWAVRGLILTSLPGPVATDAPPQTPSPCVDCPAPCIDACVGDAVSAEGLDAGRCSATRLAGPECADRCAARRACVVGPEHAYERRDEATYAAASLAWIRRASARGEA